MTFLQSLLLTTALLVPGQAADAGQGWLGVVLRAVDRPTVEEVIPDSPADLAGLQPGDVLAALDGLPTPDVEAFVALIGGRMAGDEIELSVERGSEAYDLTVELVSRPDAGDSADEPAVRSSPRRRPGAPAAPAAPVVEIRALPLTGFATDVTAAQQRAAASDLPVLMFFGASWCPATRAMARSFRRPEIVGVLGGYVPVFVDVDHDTGRADRFGVTEIPHLVVLRSGMDPDGVTGFRPPQELASFLRNHSERVPPSERLLLADVRREFEALRQEVAELAELLQELSARLPR